jgi:hypothetical protein
MPRPFLLRLAVAVAAALALVSGDVTGTFATLAWALLVLAVGSELLASAVFLRRGRWRR